MAKSIKKTTNNTEVIEITWQKKNICLSLRLKDEDMI